MATRRFTRTKSRSASSRFTRKRTTAVKRRSSTKRRTRAAAPQVVRIVLEQPRPEMVPGIPQPVGNVVPMTPRRARF